MALILLDNAAEILMYDACEATLRADESMDRIRAMGRLIDDREARVAFERSVDVKWGSGSRKRIRREFSEKVDMLEGQGRIETPIAASLKRLHTYRNEAFHRGHVRSESIRTATVVLFRIICDLWQRLGFMHSPPSEPNVDALWFASTFGVQPASLNEKQSREAVTAVLKDGLSLCAKDIQRALAVHLASRLDAMQADLQVLFPRVDLERALKHVQFQPSQPLYESFAGEQLDAMVREFRSFTPSFTKELFDTWRRRAEELTRLATEQEGFAAFAEVESQLEPLEEQVAAMLDSRERWIQAKIDEDRDK
jgi:hypothetical protein